MRRARHRWSLLWAAHFVARWEGLLLTAYLDTIASPPVYTIGYGHTGGVHYGERWTKARALDVLMHDLRWAGIAVQRAVKVPITTRQRIVLISIVYNCGPGVLEGTSLIRDLNAGNYRGAANRFLEWDHAGGVVVQGLLNRRRAERWLFTHPLHRR